MVDIRHLSGRLAALRPEYDTVIRLGGEVSSQGDFVIESDLVAELGLLRCDLYGTAWLASEEESGA